jgi:hypothetical protein
LLTATKSNSLASQTKLRALDAMSVPLDTRLRALSGAAASGSSNLPHVSAARSSAGRLARRLRAAPPSTEAPARRSLDALSATGGGNNPLASPAAGGANDSWFATEVGIRDWAEALELGASSAETVALLEEMGARYDPARLAAALASRPTALASRSVQVAAQLGGFVAAALGDAAAGRFATNAPARAAQLRRVLGGLGPAFVKVGQALSARPDLLPPEYLAALAQLQDRLPTFPSRRSSPSSTPSRSRPPRSARSTAGSSARRASASRSRSSAPASARASRSTWSSSAASSSPSTRQARSRSSSRRSSTSLRPSSSPN